MNVPNRVDATLSYYESRRRALAEFERSYVEALLRLHDGKVTKAAEAAGMDRRYLHRLIRRHALSPARPREERDGRSEGDSSASTIL